MYSNATNDGSMDIYWIWYHRNDMNGVKIINDELNINALRPETTECAIGIYSGLFLDLG
jgi:hypothetical protein